MRTSKKIGQFTIIFVMILVISVFSYYNNINTDVTVYNPVRNEDKVILYVLDADNDVVPLMINDKSKNKIEDKIKYVIDNTIKISNSNFYSIINNEVKVNTIAIKDGICSIDFNSAILNVDKGKELRLLEVLTWSMLQFNEVKRVEVSVDGKLVDKINNIPVPSVLTKDIGINNFERVEEYLHESVSLTYYLVKDIDGKKFYVPKTIRVVSGQDINSKAKQVLSQISVSSNLSSIYNDNEIMISDKVVLSDNCVEVNVNDKLLSSDNVAKEDIYKSLVLSYAEVFNVDNVLLKVNDEVVNLHGSNSEKVNVKDITYNLYEIE